MGTGKLRTIQVKESLGNLRQEMVLFYGLHSEMDAARSRIIDIAKQCAANFAKGPYA
ncbi:hypothetical protein [Vibrio breoganii]|uniref:hypothetical protein n=1 Tax=Vibrio breoganii TaxID=553239 RepID=UPI0012FFEE02|nr:hypothetical protein [Vibrio breoganii]